mmetsp:Transcript_13097/g.18756  ORF Transcript_13097/g.18756 Transcript_13097/m.18756 type:complete len:81 (-) Transcript_13097:611-853(-)
MDFDPVLIVNVDVACLCEREKGVIVQEGCIVDALLEVKFSEGGRDVQIEEADVSSIAAMEEAVATGSIEGHAIGGTFSEI